MVLYFGVKSLIVEVPVKVSWMMALKYEAFTGSLEYC